jgi:murein DD-endopeptidase MepM/ murein hydrolase activator NlpD
MPVAQPTHLRRPLSLLRRRALVAVVVVVVGLGVTACLPPAEPAPPQARIAHCPVKNFTYHSAFGPGPSGGFHRGVDMAAAEGSFVYAVRNGTLWYWSTGDPGGFSVYLKADDGNTYYYTHVWPYPMEWENSTRPVKAGDVIQFVSHTGNANGLNHLHFEIRRGGPNGTRVDPRPTLDAAGCK